MYPLEWLYRYKLSSRDLVLYIGSFVLHTANSVGEKAPIKRAYRQCMIELQCIEEIDHIQRELDLPSATRHLAVHARLIEQNVVDAFLSLIPRFDGNVTQGCFCSACCQYKQVMWRRRLPMVYEL